MTAPPGVLLKTAALISFLRQKATIALFGTAAMAMTLWIGSAGTDTLVFNCFNQGDRLIIQQDPNDTLQLRRTRPVAVHWQATNIKRLAINCLNGSDGVEIRCVQPIDGCLTAIIS